MHHPDFEKRDVSSLQAVGGGGAPTPVKQVAQVEKKFGKARPHQGYGLTETNGAVCSISADAYLLKPRSTGRPSPIVEVRITDADTGEVLRVGEVGELEVRSALVMKEYWRKPEATRKAKSPDGWFKTGDIARVDEEGFVYIMDRKKDIIIRGGENISCAEIESAFFHCPEVMECAVFGLPDVSFGHCVPRRWRRLTCCVNRIVSARELEQ